MEIVSRDRNCSAPSSEHLTNWGISTERKNWYSTLHALSEQWHDESFRSHIANTKVFQVDGYSRQSSFSNFERMIPDAPLLQQLLDQREPKRRERPVLWCARSPKSAWKFYRHPQDRVCHQPISTNIPSRILDSG